ncbi:MAG TPA: hypothetical protein VMJ74_02385 [Pseudomonadales bacterium]|nr:hypothetical protein [Pseudomonadales bacterium]
MIPRPQQALADLAMKLATSVAPDTQSAYAASNAGMIAMLMQCLAQDFDRAAAVRTQDIDELVALFESLRDVPPENLAKRIATFLRGSAESLRIEHLNARHASAMELLIELHAWAETVEADELDQEIWNFLIRHADRHAYHLPV